MHKTLTVGDPQAVGLSPGRVRSVARLAEQWVEEGSATTLVVLAARHGIVVLHEAFGRLGPELDAPALPLDAIFPLASISKPLATAAAMILVDQGQLGLNRPVQEYIPEFAGEGKERVMIHQLLTHTAGLINDEQLFALTRQRAADDPEKPFALPSAEPNQVAHYALEIICDEPLACPPGQEMAYSSLGMIVLGEIVERVASQTLSAFAHEQLFTPLAMHDTAFGFPERTPERCLRRASDQKGLHLLGRPDFPHRLDAAAGACSTAWDMAIFGQMLLNRGGYGDVRVLSRAAIAEMTRNQIPGVTARYKTELFVEGSWGLGLSIKGPKRALRRPTLDSTAAFSHDGAGGSYWWVDPVYDLVGAYFSVTPNYYPDLMEKWNVDLFVNAITAAIETP